MPAGWGRRLAAPTMSNSIGFMLLSVLAYSFFPLVGTSSVDQVDPTLFIALCHLFAFLGLLPVALVMIRRRRTAFTATRPALRSRPYLADCARSGLVNAISHASLFASFSYVNSASSTAIYEIWPVAAVVLFSRLIAEYRGTELRDWLYLGLSGGGVGLIAVSVSLGRRADALHRDWDTTIGIALALLSAGAMALSTTLSARASRRLGTMHDPLSQAVLAQSTIKVFSTLGMTTVFLLLFAVRGASPHLDAAVVGLAAGTGIFIIALGAVTFQIGNILATSPIINLLWFLTPVISLLWLDITGLAEITRGIATGAIVIIAGNLLMTTRADPQTAYTGTVLGLCLSIGICGVVLGDNDEHYFDMVATVAGVFAILVAFMLQRVTEKGQRVGEAAIDLLEAVRRSSQFPDEQRARLTASILTWLGNRHVRPTRPPEGTEGLVPPELAGKDDMVDERARRLVASTAAVVSFGERLVLVILAGLIIVILHISRPNTFAGDLFPVVLSGVVIFLGVRVWEEHDSVRVASIRRIYGGPQTPEPSSGTGSRFMATVSALLLVGILALYTLTLLRVYGVPFTFAHQ
ncbi:hypothetical protein GCM10022223_30090 [Kineosporia mesophila]|uniref:Uncharacterized protein n=1 Tax=Kineosporia mesophila TaxID=566012 RepID=A0ABP6ZLU9_9ACTN|nr:DMT family transporter [Kineosporia mesophila]MCD5349574.1 DMT family transporter [Kineosporia mesophila]